MKSAATARRAQAERRGRIMEKFAALFFLAKGYAIIARRARTPRGEIDLIVRRGNVLVLVEVKTRASLDEGLGAVNAHQQKRIIDAFNWWLARHSRYANCSIRYLAY